MGMRFIDFHCDTLTLDNDDILRTSRGHVNLDKLKRGGAWVQFFALFIPTGREASEVAGGPLAPHAFYERYRAVWRREMAANAAAVAPAADMADIRANTAAGRISAVLSVEDAAALEGRLERVDELYADGVRLMTLTWNHENELGWPHAADPERMGLGLKPFGVEVVRRMNELGMIVDVSHLSDGGFADVARMSSAPFVSSHSCVRSLSGHTRCLTDAQLRTLGDKGGVVGLNFCPRFLREGSSHATIDDMVRHALHIRDKAGVEALALGSDFDGIPGTLEFGDYAGLPRLADALERHVGAADLDKICSGNALRIMTEVWR